MLRARNRQEINKRSEIPACSDFCSQWGTRAIAGAAKARILIVEDDPDTRLALSSILEDASYEVIEAAGASGIVGMVRNRDPDLILLDLVMPQISGFDALTMLKGSKHTRDVPVVVVTALGRREDSDEARARGASACVKKPWASGEIERCVDRILAASAEAARSNG